LLVDATVRTSTIAKDCKVSIATAKRAINKLVVAELVDKFQGGAKSPSNFFYTRSPTTPVVKPQIVGSIAQLVESGQAIMLDSNPLAISLSRHLPLDLFATIYTNSLDVAATFAQHKQVEIRVIGGRLTNGLLVPVEDEEFEFLKSVRAGLCVLGSCYLDRKGITGADREMAKLKSAMISHASKVVLLISADTLDKVGQNIIGPLEILTHVVLQDEVPASRLNPYKSAGVKILHA
jgi:DeoR/GlpR family transcriptional regulator of sugar metabolism